MLRLHLSLLEQRLEEALVRDLEYQTRRLVYTWTRRADSLSLELGNELRDPSPGRSTDSLRLALRYRRAFQQRIP